MSVQIGIANGYLDLLDKLDAFLCNAGHAWGKTYSGVGNGTLTDYQGKPGSVAETFTLTAINSTTFSVVGSVSGTLPNATVGTPYSSSKIDFLLSAGSVPFSAGDQFRISTSPPWTRLRYHGCIDGLDRYGVGPWNTTYTPDRAFDGTTNYARADGFPAWLGVTMHKPSEVNVALLTNADSTTQAPKDVAIEWSDDGANWTTAQTWTGLAWSTTYETKTLTLATPPGAHRWWRLRIDSTQIGQTMASIAELQLRAHIAHEWSLEDNFQAAWAAPGLDGSKAIHVGIIPVRNQAADTYNLTMRAWRFHDGNKSIEAQHNVSTRCVMSLTDQPMNYWLVANGQRVIVAAKISTTYQLAYLGFGFPYEPPSVHPWPCVIAGTSEDSTMRWSSTHPNHRLAFMPGDGMHAYYPDNLWRRVRNRSGGSGDDGSGDGSSGKVWPSAWNSGGAVLDWLRDRLDGGHVLIPCSILHAVSPVFHAWGELDGLYWVSGFGQTAESLIAADGYEHLVIDNVFRTGLTNWGAIRLD